MRLRTRADAARLDFAKGSGLLPVIAQDARTGAVLMQAYASREAVERTLESGDMHYYSRARRSLWKKGETSGNVQHLVALYHDCDGDALLALVVPAGPACHTGAPTCFGGLPAVPALAATIAARAAASAAPDLAAADAGGGGAHSRPSYTQRLLADANLRHKKLGEESVELALACAARDRPRVAEEAADLLYHVLVAAAAAGVPAEEVLDVLRQRALAVPPHDDQPVRE
jgi:phosphoribosyl-AMP cyclohydrolase / phosphoribosyl-ATP pyrophosphohydrolase